MKNLIKFIFSKFELNPLIILFFCIFIIYLAFSAGEFYNKSSTAYYNYLIDAFFHGRVDLYSPTFYDLSFFAGKWYLYWGPAPTLFILPFYLLWGINANDILYTVIAGLLNVLLFYLLLKEFTKFFKINLKFFPKVFILLSFALASPNFYLSISGRIWSTYQVISIFYLLLFYLFYFKFLNNFKKLSFLVLAVIFYNLAWLSRYPLIFNLLLFVYPLILIRKNLIKTKIENNLYSENRKKFLKTILTIITITCFFVTVFLGYNYSKFGNPFETGLRYQIGSTRYDKIIKDNAIFSINYIQYNFKYYFLNHVLTFKKPFLNIDLEGNSIFSVYPISILLLFLIKNKYLKKYKLFLTIAFLITMIHLTFLLVYFATGWTQFGSRYFFDITPLLFLLAAFLINDIPIFIQIPLLFYGIIVNLIGAILYIKPF